MYEAFYGLKEKPFNLTPDPRFLFLSEKHKEAFAHLLFGIKNRTGFIMVSGEIGTGKTTICRSLLSRLDDDVDIAFIFNPFLSPEELLRKINEDFGIESKATTIKDLIDELNEYLLDRHVRGRNCVLVIDEAQDLTPQVLEQVRLLSNLETEKQKLLQIVLIGQPELAQQLELPELRQLNQRITARYHLRALDERETLQYVAYRLRVSGARGKIRFSHGAIKAVYRFSRGTPRVVNAICDRALLIGYTLESCDITAKVVKRAAKEVRGERIRARRESLIKKYIPSPRMVAAAVLIVLCGQFLMVPMLNNLHLFLREPSPGMGAADSLAAPAQGQAQLPDRTVHAQSVPAPAETSEQLETATAPEQAKPATEPLADVLDTLDPETARKAAALGILEKWNMALLGGYPKGDTVKDLSDFASDNGLACEPLFPTLEDLAMLDLPAFVKVKKGPKSGWLALVGIDKETVQTTANGDALALFDRSEFRSFYLNQAVVLWQDSSPKAPILKASMKGKEVTELQQRLSQVGRLAGGPTGVYDEATIEAITRIQAQTGLTPDGKAGKQIRMVLSSWLPDSWTPSLKANEPGATEIALVQPETSAPQTATADEMEAIATPDTPAPALEARNESPTTPDTAPAATTRADEMESEIVPAGLTPVSEPEPAEEARAKSPVDELLLETMQTVPASQETALEKSALPQADDSNEGEAQIPAAPLPISQDAPAADLAPLVSQDNPDEKDVAGGKQTTAPSLTGLPLVPRDPGESGAGRDGAR